MAKDLFSAQASLYARYRPVYPAALYTYITSFVNNRHCAWDCATGNGQAAIVLASLFEKVYATDISEKQLQQATVHPGISYACVSAEATGFPDRQFDCITVAQAYHWFDFEAFHQEVTRVARAGAVLAVWGYGLIHCEDEKVSNSIASFYRNKTGPYWDPERKYIDDQYATVPFPYKTLPSAGFRITMEWNKEMLSGYLNTWSSVQHFIKEQGYNPVNTFMDELLKLWPDDDTRSFYFPVFLRLARL